MKLVFMGNVCNFAYWFAKWGRRLGFDTHVLLEDDITYERDLPQWEDPEYDPARPPPWVHTYQGGSPWQRARRGYCDTRLPVLLEQFDAVHTLSPAAAIALGALGRAHVHHTVGSFGRTSRWWRGLQPRLALSPRRIPTVARFRKAMGHARHIVVSTATDRAEVEAGPFGGKVVPVPIAYDVDLAAPYARRRADAAAASTVRFLMPARQSWDLKGQDIVFRGLALLPPSARAGLDVVAFDWGTDRARSKQLVAELGLDHAVRFGPMLPKHALWAELSRPEVVVIDQVPNLDFHGGAIGGVARDAMAVGAPVITHAAPEAQLAIHRSPPPVLHTPCTPEGVRDRVLECLSLGPTRLYAVGQAEQEWLHEECHYDKVLPAYLGVHEGARR